MWSGQWPGPEPAGLGQALASTMIIVLRAGPGLDILFAGRAGPGPHNSVCGPGPGRVCTTAAGLGRAWASNHICGPGLGLNFRPVQGPSTCDGVIGRKSPKTCAITISLNITRTNGLSQIISASDYHGFYLIYVTVRCTLTQ